VVFLFWGVFGACLEAFGTLWCCRRGPRCPDVTFCSSYDL
jgi:hypothetical protein